MTLVEMDRLSGDDQLALCNDGETLRALARLGETNVVRLVFRKLFVDWMVCLQPLVADRRCTDSYGSTLANAVVQAEGAAELAASEANQ